jgi:polysaccharide chain length determinant protein (PEP-CTERM system associated)
MAMTGRSLEQLIPQVRAYWNLLVKHKWQCAIATLALTLVFTVIIAKLPNVYQATTTILVDPQQVPEKYVAAVSSDPYARLNTITQQVLSRSRLQKIIEKFGLYPELRGSLSSEELVVKMRGDITIEVKQGSGVELSTFSLTYQGRQPELVAKVTNELAASFIDWSIASRVEQVAGTKDFLTSELNSAKENLEQQEDKLRRFKMSHLGETPDQIQTNLQALAGLRSDLRVNAETMNRLDEERISLTSSPEPVTLLGRPNVQLTPRELLESEKRQLESDLETLRSRYSERHPDVVTAISRLEEVNARLSALPSDAAAPADQSSDGTQHKSAVAVRLELIDKEMKRLKAQQSHTQSQIDSYQARVDAAPIREQQLVELTRNYDTSKLHYQTLLDKSFNVAMAADLEQNQKGERFRVMDLARVPEKPIRPQRKILIAVSGVVAFGLSILCVFVKDAFSAAVKTEMELKSLLPKDVQIWGSIPHIEIATDKRRARRFAVCASLACVLLGLVLIRVIQGIRLL